MIWLIAGTIVYVAMIYVIYSIALKLIAKVENPYRKYSWESEDDKIYALAIALMWPLSMPFGCICALVCIIEPVIKSVVTYPLKWTNKLANKIVGDKMTEHYCTIEQRSNVNQWLIDLRSGNFNQGFGSLKIIDHDDISYCCLGVLQEAHEEINMVDDSWIDDNICRSILTMPVANSFTNLTGLSYTVANDLSDLNDSHRASFAKIAAKIEETMTALDPDWREGL